MPDTKKFVVLDVEGAPGCIYRAFLVLPRPENATVKLHLDGRLIFEGELADIFASGMNGRLPGPFLHYMVGGKQTLLSDVKAMNMVFPFCFNSSAFMTVSFGNELKALQPISDCVMNKTKCPAKFYANIGLERRMELPAGWDLYDYTRSLEAPNGESWDQYLSYTSTYQRIVEEAAGIRNFSVVIGNKNSKDLFHFLGKGVIKSIVLRIPNAFWDLLSWERTWDHAANPQVQAPLDRMYNSWRVGNEPLLGYQLGAFEKDRIVNAYNFYPMPFLEKAVGKIFNHGNSSVTIDVTITYTLSRTPDTHLEYHSGAFGYYHVKRVVKDWGQCYNELLSLQNQTGHIVAISWYLPGRFGVWEENDPVMYTDDALTPNMWYSGLEDGIGGGNGFNWHLAHPGPVLGWYHLRQDDPSKDEASACRLGFSDNYYFMRNYRYGIQGHSRDDKQTRDLDYTFHWYSAPWPSLVLTDQVDMGNASSLAHHGYESKPSTLFVSLTSAVHGQWYNYVEKGHDCPQDKRARMTKRGVIMGSGGVITFKARIKTHNAGIILRRLVDLFYTPQRALVYIDDQFVGIWTCSDHVPEFAPQRFADNTDFLIPPRFTKGKTSIRISLLIERRKDPHVTNRRTDYKHIKGFGWTAFHYWIYAIIQDLSREPSMGKNKRIKSGK